MKYKSGYQYVIQEGIEARLPDEFGGLEIADADYVSIGDREIGIDSHYAWDGASCILFTWFGTPERWLVPSLVHDALYQLMQDGKLPLNYRKDADLLFYQLLRDRGVWWISATVAYYAVHWFGNYFARHGRQVREVV